MRKRTEQLPLGVAGDRRRSKRVEVDLSCQAVTDEDFFLLGDQIVEASSTGLLLRAADVPALVGETVIVSFKPPRSDEWIDAEAKVVRLITGKRRGAPGFGLELSALSPFDRERLGRSLERWAPKRPRPRVTIERRRPTRATVASRPTVTIRGAGEEAAHGPLARRTVVVR